MRGYSHIQNREGIPSPRESALMKASITYKCDPDGACNLRSGAVVATARAQNFEMRAAPQLSVAPDADRVIDTQQT